MADRIMSPPNPPVPPPTAAPAAPAVPADPELSAADIIENNLEQLHSLLCCCHGDEGLVLQGADPHHLNNVMWLAATLLKQTQTLFQEVLKQ
ncbi:hypothetical protein VLK31_28075 [Variovorax sp. H27-G14]|uniref:hypothetical protein n=1 Tax=Variovorax sp. H27-G14 TaxID=3111914 RepID=UPI0038FCEC73